MSLKNKSLILAFTDAFTLVEVTLAIGITSFAVLTIVGLNGVGLSTLRAAKESTVVTEVMQSMSSEARLSDYSQIDSLAGTRYYDQEVKELSDAEAENSTFAVVVSVSQPVSAMTRELSTDHIKRLTLDFYRSPNGEFQPGIESREFISRRSVFVANSERDQSVGS